MKTKITGAQTLIFFQKILVTFYFVMSTQDNTAQVIEKTHDFYS